MNKENKYYVYGHYTVEDDKLFYIGKGTGNRLNKTNRSKDWNDFVKSNEWYPKVICSGLNSEDALKLEKELIISSDVINKSINNSTKPITADILEWFYYDTNSPTSLVWSKNVVGANGRIYKTKGQVAGREHHTSDLKSKRYIVIFNGSQYYVHRIVYALFHPTSSDKVIDHVDGNSLNNKIENLREVFQGINAKNVSRISRSNTGVNGVTRTKRKRLDFSIYIASWYSLDGKLCSKEFSSFKHGEQEALRLATEWRKEQIRLLNEQGAGYTERHGT